MRFVLLVAVLLLGAGCGGDDRRPPAEPLVSPPPPASAVGPGLTVSEALESEAKGALLVRGFLYARDGEIRICEALAESYPPQCGGASLRVDGLDLSEVEGLQRAHGVSWTERDIKLLGKVEDGVLTVSDTAQA